MAAYLTQLQSTSLSETSNHPAEQWVRELQKEFWCMMALTILANPGSFKDVQNCKVDEGVVCPDAQPPSFYCDLMVSQHVTAASKTSQYLGFPAYNAIDRYKIRPVFPKLCILSIAAC